VPMSSHATKTHVGLSAMIEYLVIDLQTEVIDPAISSGPSMPRMAERPMAATDEGWRWTRLCWLWAHNAKLGMTNCTIITAPAVPEIDHIHTRMPGIVDPASYERWLSGEDQGDHAKALLGTAESIVSCSSTVSARIE
jgi:putative SOS response-associated peptidase YedK